MRLDGKVAVVIGKRIGAICVENGAAIVRTGHDIVVSSGWFLQ